MQTDKCLCSEETWDAIAESFDTTRKNPWGFCVDFISSLKDTDIVADVGCGNGRHIFFCAGICKSVVGVDISKKLLGIVHMRLREKNIKNISLIHADAVQTPLRENTFDAVLFIASLHNIKGKVHRQNALREINRILKPNGVALISVWSRWQDAYRTYFMKQFFIGSEEFGDINIHWRQHHLNVPRFYHLYSKREFIKDLTSSDCNIEEVQSIKLRSKRFADNFFAIIRKR